MVGSQRTVRDLTREFYRGLPDYQFCRTLAQNVEEQTVTYPQALQFLARKREAQQENREAIQEKLDRRSVELEGRRVFLRQMTLRQILQLNDAAFQEVLEFYFRHPYAHQRTLNNRWAPRWIRSFFLRVLFGHARSRQLQIDYRACHEILRLL